MWRMEGQELGSSSATQPHLGSWVRGNHVLKLRLERLVVGLEIELKQRKSRVKFRVCYFLKRPNHSMFSSPVSRRYPSYTSHLKSGIRYSGFPTSALTGIRALISFITPLLFFVNENPAVTQFFLQMETVNSPCPTHSLG